LCELENSAVFLASAVEVISASCV